MSRILIVQVQAHEAQRLSRLLAPPHTVQCPAQPSLALPRFDLCLLDASLLPTWAAWLRTRRQTAAPALLPVLLVIPSPSPSPPECPEDLVDDVVSIAAPEAEIRLRVAALLRTRGLSLRLAATTARAKTAAPSPGTPPPSGKPTPRRRPRSPTADAQLRALAASPFDGIAVSARGRLIEVNDALATLLGASAAELRGQPVLTFIAPESRAMVAAALRSPTATAYECLAVRCDGSRFVAEVQARVVRLGRRHVRLSSVRDITHRKRAEEALRESESRYRRLHESITDAFVRVDMEGRLLEWNRAYREMLGYDDEALARLTYRDLTPAHWHAFEARIVAEQILPRGYSDVYEKEYLRNGGAVFPVELRTYLLRDDAGQPTAMWAIVRDITERKRAEERLRESEERFRQFAENIREVFWLLDARTRRVLYVSPAYEYTWGRPVAAVLADPAEWIRSIHPEDQARVSRSFETLASTDAWHEEYRVVRPDGSVRWVHDRSFPIRDPAGRIVRLAGLAEDITERRHAAMSLSDSREQLRALASRLQAAREEERLAIAREVHDRIGQGLTSMNLDVFWLREHLERLPRQELLQPAVKRLAAITALLKETTQVVQRLCSELRPELLDDLGLAAAIEWLAQEFVERTHLACELACAPLEAEPPLGVSTAIFRILQELLANVARHAQASQVEIALYPDGHQLILRVQDNGRGLTAAEARSSKSLGLLGMRERALAVGGTLEFTGTPGRGTLVLLQVPLSLDPALPPHPSPAPPLPALPPVP